VQLFNKVGMEIMPPDATPPSYFLISYHQ